MASEDQEKTEEASQTRRDEFRRRGEVVQSRELASAFFLMASAGVLYVFARHSFVEIYEMFQYSFGAGMVAAIRQGDLFSALKMSGSKMMALIAPFLGMTFIVGFGSSVLQIGFLKVEDAVTPKWEKIDPIAGFKRMFALRNLVEAIKSIFKMSIVGGIVYLILEKQIFQLPLLIQYGPEQMLVHMGELTVRLLLGIGFAMLVLAGADYFYQRWSLEKKMMMTKQEIKEEHKQQEGDPLIRQRIRKIQREVANRRMMEKVPKADVIITNPTHIAVALKYDANLPAPQLIAKGADLVAERIREIAREHNIPIVENKPLARTIFKTLKLGQVIPRELFVAVAEVLSYVYKLRRRKRSS